MTRGRARRSTEPDLFSVDPSSYLPLRLSELSWPDSANFPLNHATATTRSQVWTDLVASPNPRVVAGFASIAELIELSAAWAANQPRGELRLLIGSEPFDTERTNFASSRLAFTDDVREYWLEVGVSLRQSAKIVNAISLIESGRIRARFVEGDTRLHAKIYVGEDAATVGSSNFTRAGLSRQFEANARFTAGHEPDRYNAAATIAANYWSIGSDWNEELVALLQSLLRFVPWQEALAKACADLLEGEWASRYVSGALGDRLLWPSQRLGIAQALWIAENVGSVLVADATGSGKTRMGAHLVRAVRDRLWSTGRVRGDLTVLVCPPGVRNTWFSEAVSCGLTMHAVSHGLLSRTAANKLPRVEQEAVREAQILAIDEAHNFLSSSSKRTRQVRDSLADHVLLFTATPINRGASDLLQLVGLLGADNFEDDALAVLDRLDRRRGAGSVLGVDEQAILRREIQRFTVRRTKQTLNALVERDPDAYRDPESGRVAQYPSHRARTYRTGETERDCSIADEIRSIVDDFDGIVQLNSKLEVPTALHNEYTAERWLQLRLGSAKGLAGHHVLGAMRSSRAALVEHLVGTQAARDVFGLGQFKALPTGNMIAQLQHRSMSEPPPVSLSCEVPDWLTDTEAWQQRCRTELKRYERIQELAGDLSNAREQSKAELLSNLSHTHDRVLAFDHHLITLAHLDQLLTAHDFRTVVATGGDKRSRQEVEGLFAIDSSTKAIALCSDAMNEGFNLQGASTIVHLDLPTTLRMAEQRVGRVDRMNSPHDEIEAWWPDDGPSFATRSNELLVQRAAESTALLGSNLPLPQFGQSAQPIDLAKQIEHATSDEAQRWDGIQDALDPVRSLVEGERAIVPARTYEEYRSVRHRVVARVSPIASACPWAFFAIAGTAHGAPRWLLLEGDGAEPTIELDLITDRLRTLLGDDPPAYDFDDLADRWLARFLDAASATERQLLPRRLQRALGQMIEVTGHWAEQADDVERSQRWSRVRRLAAGTAESDDLVPDSYVVAQRWIELVTPRVEEHRAKHRSRRYTLLRDITPRLLTEPLDIAEVEGALTGLQAAAPIEQRITACILGVPVHQGDV